MHQIKRKALLKAGLEYLDSDAMGQVINYTGEFLKTGMIKHGDDYCPMAVGIGVEKLKAMMAELYSDAARMRYAHSGTVPNMYYQNDMYLNVLAANALGKFIACINPSIKGDTFMEALRLTNDQEIKQVAQEILNER